MAIGGRLASMPTRPAATIVRSLVLASILLLPIAGCTGKGAAAPEANVEAVDGIDAVVTGISDNHGNVYLDVAPDRYAPLGLEPGRDITATWAGGSLTMPVGQDYTSVPPGEPVAVLHREGLTLAIRDGNFSQTRGLSVGDALAIRVE
jgi:S-adenosylmethionine hydrolase